MLLFCVYIYIYIYKHKHMHGTYKCAHHYMYVVHKPRSLRVCACTKRQGLTCAGMHIFCVPDIRSCVYMCMHTHKCQHDNTHRLFPCVFMRGHTQDSFRLAVPSSLCLSVWLSTPSLCCLRTSARARSLIHSFLQSAIHVISFH